VSRIRKEPSLAIPFYAKALQLYPQYAITHAQYGSYLTDIGQVEQGIVALKKAVEIDPKLALAYDWLARAYAKSGDLELSRQAAEKAKELGLKNNK
jgi:superkiller protein 3